MNMVNKGSKTFASSSIQVLHPNEKKRVKATKDSVSIENSPYWILGDFGLVSCYFGTGAFSARTARQMTRRRAMTKMMKRKNQILAKRLCSPRERRGLMRGSFCNNKSNNNNNTTIMGGTSNGTPNGTASQWGQGLTQNDLMEKDTVLVLDDGDNVIGSASKKESHVFSVQQPRAILHRAFSVFLFDKSDGRLLLQQRASTKITFPNVRM